MNTNNLKWIIKTIINHYYYGYIFYSNFFATNKKNRIDKNTDILIEGYPRSGNTYCVANFLVPNRSLNIASHRHEIGHIHAACKNKIPTLVIVREPKGAISSLILRERVSFNFAIKFYISFHRKLLQYKENILIVDFSTLIKDPAKVIEMFNVKYNLNYKSVSIDDIDLVKNEVFEMEKKDSGTEEIRQSHIAFPTEKKEKMKLGIKNNLENNYKHSLNIAKEAYKVLIAK